MRNPFKIEVDTPLDEQITSVLNEMSTFGVDSEEYPTLLSHLERLYELKAKTRPEPVSRETMAVIVGNLTGILIIVAYEQHHVITSKAMNQIGRIKT